jgi:hypothetical protein
MPSLDYHYNVTIPLLNHRKAITIDAGGAVVASRSWQTRATGGEPEQPTLEHSNRLRRLLGGGGECECEHSHTTLTLL